MNWTQTTKQEKHIKEINDQEVKPNQISMKMKIIIMIKKIDTIILIIKVKLIVLSVKPFNLIKNL